MNIHAEVQRLFAAAMSADDCMPISFADWLAACEAATGSAA